MHKAHAPVKPSPCSRAATGCSKPSSVSSFTLESSAGRRRSSSPILSRGLQPAHPQRPASAAPRLALELRRVMSVSNVSSPTIPDSSNGTYQHIRSNLCTRLSGSGVLLRPHSPAVEHDGTHASTPINRPGGGSSSHDNAESLAGRGAVRASAAVASPSCTGSPRAHADGLRLLHDDPVPADAGTDATALERAGSSGSPLGCRRYDVPGWFERQDWPVPGRFSQELVSTPPLRADRSPRQHTSPLEGGVLIGSAVRGHSPRPHAAAAGDGSRQAHETLARRYQYDLPRGPSSPWSLSHAASSSMAIDGNRCQSSDMCTVCGICGRRVSRSPRQSSAPLFDLHHPSTPFTPLVAPSGPSRVLVREGNPSLGITFRPDALSAAGLEQALAAAKRTVIPGRAAGAALIADAEKRLAAQQRDFRRCAGKRSVRLEAFLGCRPLLATARALYDAACRGQPKGVTHDAMTGSTTTHQGALGRGAFLDLHLSLSREGVLDPGVVGKVMSRYPFCYAAPRYVRRLEGHWPKRQPNESDVVETGEEVLTDEVTGERLTGRASSGLAAWDDGIRLWALLQGSGLVEGDNEHGGSISASAFEQIAFEIADAHVTFACMGDKADGATDTTQITVGASTHVPLQAYLDVLTRLVERVVTDEPPVPTRARKLEHGGVLVRGDSADGTDGTDGGVCECSPRLRHGWPCVGSEMAGAAVQRKLSVLHAAILANAQRPQHFDGRQGLACHEGVTRATLVEEWRRYRSALGLEVRGGSKLTFAQLDRAFRSMEGLYYERLTHRFATSTHGGEGVAEGVRLRARWADDDETLCLLRWLDQDGDGLLSKKDFLLGLLSQGHDAIPMLGKKWVALRDLRVLERSLARAKMDAQIPPKVNSRS